ncbi:MAG: hypothetical protein HY293_13140 [Planctomycetes bacterium]|nr:hypothetical protein [Planctomycetota bacterium]
MNSSAMIRAASSARSSSTTITIGTAAVGVPTAYRAPPSFSRRDSMPWLRSTTLSISAWPMIVVE